MNRFSCSALLLFLVSSGCGGSTEGPTTNQSVHGTYEVDGATVELMSQLAGVQVPPQPGVPGGTTWKLSLLIGVKRVNGPVALIVEAPFEESWAENEAAAQQVLLLLV